jgi:CheY-like chemotaxis protein
MNASCKKVLLVDDNRDAADSLAMLLEIGGHEVAAAYSAEEALQRASEIKPRVILLDIGLPDLDGYEVARRMRSMPELDGVRLIALTGYGHDEDRRRTREAGFDQHLVKPVDLDDLEKALAG